MKPVLSSAVLATAIALAMPASAAPRLDVVASFSILGDMVARIGGDRVAVKTLVGPDGDAHVYQPTPADAETVAKADLVVVNGLGFEGFLTRLLEASEYKGPVVTASSAVTPRTGFVDEDEEPAAGEAHDHDHAAESGHDDHDHGGLDPHAWQDIGNGIRYVEAIRAGLCAADAEGCPEYDAAAKAYATELKALDDDIRARIGAVPKERRVVITSHDAFGYYGAAYGITFLAPQGVSTDSEAGAAAVAGLIRQIRETGIHTLFVENIADPRLIEQIAAETGAKLGPKLFSDALSPADGPAPTYAAMMHYNADALIRSMSGGS
ncbi:manganese ABC transporter substrate-binding lipoprotein precursor [Pleomorphomonas sp. SM30]|uniref:Zinc/manganese transport system substrate-binding protein n=2 Tax=Oharaeibacter diazotrophicus TaxID=1920512 RepID=A0A4R6RAB5_9HYPH|nr:zinc/manganese transport system substrate-binding protein [Oharaeibacter diazotrophicus]BBE72650.1 manganese ABC transporter substrate-binding lipoprotein precursor [Pleomorphomonas sp. SM30]GLS76684.1 metal ABC transporter substrate-binding protein [Oharaeibacter diazotrophicus]